MFHAQIRQASDLGHNYPELASIAKKRNPVIIKNDGQNETVLIAYEEFEKCREILHNQYIQEELAKAEIEAADPNVKWIPHDEVWRRLRDEYGF